MKRSALLLAAFVCFLTGCATPAVENKTDKTDNSTIPSPPPTGRGGFSSG